MPVLSVDDDTRVFMHERPSWQPLHEIELGAGFGGMTQGILTSGFHAVAAVDQNQKMMRLYSQQGSAERIRGNVNSLSSLVKLWPVVKGAGVVAAGFACQPFSLLGGQRGGSDARAMGGVGWGACINVHVNLQMKYMLRFCCRQVHVFMGGVGWGGVGWGMY